MLVLGMGVVVVVVSAWHVGGPSGSGTVSSASDVLWTSVVRGMRGVGGVCEMCLCFGCSGVGGVVGEWVEGLHQGLEG